MIPWLVPTVIAALLAGCLSAAGLGLLGPGGRSLGRVNAAFLAGGGVFASLLFPASLLLGDRALETLTIVLLAIGLSRVVIRPVRIAPVGGESRTTRRALPTLPRILACVAIAAGLATFATLNFRYAYLWDGFQIWASKAMVLHHAGRLTREIWPDARDMARLAEYPNLIPLYGAMLSWLRGAFAFGALKPIFLVFYLSLVVGTVSAGAAVLPSSLSLFPAAVLVLLPPVTLGFAAGGYADMPMAAVVAGLCAAWLGSDRHDLRGRVSTAAWLGATLLTVKLEGVLHLVSALAALVLVRGVRRLLGRESLRANGWSIAVILGSVAVRQGYSSWLGIQDPTYGPLDRRHLAGAIARVPTVARLCVGEMLRLDSWALLWPAAAAGVILLLAFGGERERVLGLGLFFAVLAAAAPYLLTNWELRDHVRLSYGRIVSQLAPAACLVAVTGARRAWTHAALSGPRGLTR